MLKNKYLKQSARKSRIEKPSTTNLGSNSG